MKKSADYEAALLEDLRDPGQAAAYLTAAFEENSTELFLLALARVIRVHGVSATSAKAGLHRVTLHKILSGRGNPELHTLSRLLDAAGLRMAFHPKKQAA